jgi:hypothetical protein
MMGNQNLPVSIAQLDPLELELLSGDESIEITISTRPDGGGTGKKTFRTTLNNVLGIYARRKDNPNDVTAEQVGSFTIEQMTAILKEKLGVDEVAVNSLRLGGSTKEQIIEEARSGTVNDSNNLGGLPAGDYVLNSELSTAFEKMAQSFDDMTVNIST